MILDSLSVAHRYVSLNPGFEAGMKFLTQPGLAGLEDGRYEIDGPRVYALVMRRKGSGKNAAKLETHDRYIDIQCTVAGLDVIGWRSRACCREQSEGYSAEKDLELYSARPDSWIAVPPASFAIFFPEDAHAPLATAKLVHKVVVKIAVP